MDDEILNEFVNESREHLADIEADLLAIEEGGAHIDEKLVNKVFRAAHSIKGASGFFGLTKVKDLAHKAETVLDMLRSRQMAPNAEITNVLLAAFDKLREMINQPSESEGADTADLVAGLTGLASSYLPQAQKASLHQEMTLRSDRGATATVPRTDFDRVSRAGKYVYRVEYDLIHDVERQGRDVLGLFRDLWGVGDILNCDVDFEAAGTLDDTVGTRLPLRLVYATVLEPGDIHLLFPAADERIELLRADAQPTAPASPALPPPSREPAGPPAAEPSAAPKPAEPPAAPPPSEPRPAAVAAVKAEKGPAPHGAGAEVEETIRVNVRLLETLMNLAGELVLSRNQLRASLTRNNPRALIAANQRIGQVTSELQDAIMQTRLQPIGNVLGKLPRVVRDLCSTLGKDIQLDIRGREVALDKSLVEGLSDPLTHMIRNAVDHGVETPDERARAGKPRQGTVRVEARHEAGQVVLEIADDGKGIDPEKIARAAASKGLMSPERLQGLSAQDKVALLFLPGLSTAERVSDVSGRGVGMDVVKTNLDRLGGKVEIASEPGTGTTFRIKLPLTLAIIPSLVVSAEGERFAIPQINVEELLRVLPSEAKTRTEVVGGAEVLVLRERLIPLLRFADLLGDPPSYLDPATGRREVDRRTRLADRRSPRHPSVAPPEDLPASPTVRGRDRRRAAESALEIAVITTGTQSYALVVDDFHDTEEIVVKPLGRDLKHLTEYAGATILGDGTVALIVDVAGLAAKADLTAVSGTARGREQAEAAERERLADVHSLLLFHDGAGGQCAAPLDAVLRIEHVGPDQVETVGGRRTMQYRGGSLPLVTLSDAAAVSPLGDAPDLAVMVSSIRGREVGLLGAMPVDVVETRTAIDQSTHRQTGVAGSAIVRGRTTLVADLYELVDAVWPEWVPDQTDPAGPVARAGTVLLAEDSDFFRHQVERFLAEGGYEVLTAPDGEAAWELLLANADRVRAVVTDIEMPNLDGLGLARRIRGDRRTAPLPIIALTSLAGEEDVARGKAAGIDDYQIKLDRDRLLERLRTELQARDTQTSKAQATFERSPEC